MRSKLYSRLYRRRKKQGHLTLGEVYKEFEKEYANLVSNKEFEKELLWEKDKEIIRLKRKLEVKEKLGGLIFPF